MALFTHGIGGNFLKHTLKAYGIAEHRRALVRAVPRPARRRLPAHLRRAESARPSAPTSATRAASRCIGSHLGENMHNTQVQEFAEAVGQRRDDHRRRPALLGGGQQGEALPADQARHRHRAAAGLDERARGRGALRPEYVAAHGFGFDAFAAEIAPSRRSGPTRSPASSPALIRETAREMARHRPASLVHPGRHVDLVRRRRAAQPRDRAPQRAARHLGPPGRLLPARRRWSVPEYPYPPYPHRRGARPTTRAAKYPFAERGAHHRPLRRHAHRRAAIRSRAGWSTRTNLLQALPDEAETDRAPSRSSTCWSSSTSCPAEIAGWADVVLPESVYLERYDDLNVELFREPFVALRQPVVEAPADQKPNWWIARELALKLGLGAYYPWKDDRGVPRRTGSRAAGLSLAELKTKGVVRGARAADLLRGGRRPDVRDALGKIEFYSQQLGDAGFDPVPRYSRPRSRRRAPSACSSAARRCTRSAARRPTRSSRETMPRERGLAERRRGARGCGPARRRPACGCATRTASAQQPVRVKATERIRGDCVYMVHGFGHTASGLRRALGRAPATRSSSRATRSTRSWAAPA